MTTVCDSSDIFSTGGLERVEGDQEYSYKPTYFLPDANDVPLVVHVGTKSEHGSFEAFRRHVTNNELTFDGPTLTYDDEWGELTFRPDSTDPDRIRLVDGEPVEYDRDELFDSPHLHSGWESGVIRARVGDTMKIYNFRTLEEKTVQQGPAGR